MTDLDWERARKAAEEANKDFGQWMPQRWLELFRQHYDGRPPPPVRDRQPPSEVHSK